MNKVDYALAAAGRGWKVLALQPNRKEPLKTALQQNGCKDATDVPDKIRMLWAEFPEANIGIATGKASGITVLDLDDRKNSKLSLQEEIDFTEPPATYGVETPRGWHFYFQYDKSLSNSVNRVNKCDIRNDGGYVVAVGSVVDGKQYEQVGVQEIASWQFPAKFKKEQPQDYFLTNNEEILGRRKRWKEIEANGIAEGSRDVDMFELGCSYRARGLGMEQIELLLFDINAKNQPPLPEQDVHKILRSVARFQQGEQGIAQGALMEPPLIEAETDRRTTFYWVERDIRVQLSNVDRRGVRAYAKMRVTSAKNMIYMASISLYDQRSRESIASYLTMRHPLAPWNDVLHHVAAIVDKSSDKPGKVIDLATHKPKSLSPYLIYPLVRQNQSTVLYADGGSGKSTFALAIAATGATLGTFIPGVRNTARRPIKTLYLDWEADDDDVSQMLAEISRGAGVEIPENHVVYQNMSGAFIDHVDDLVQTVIDNDIELIVVDSLVASAGGDVTDAEAARMYHNAVRSLKVASIGITHTNKSDGLYGSRFFWNLARQVFRVTSVAEPQTNPVLGLYHEKSNRSQLNSPVAWEVEYENPDTPDALIRYKVQDIQSVPELAKGTGLRERIIGVLRNGSYTPMQLADRLNESDEKIRETLERHSATFVKTGGLSDAWTLVEERTD